MLSSFSGLIFWSLELVVELDCYSSAFKFKNVAVICILLDERYCLLAAAVNCCYLLSYLLFLLVKSYLLLNGSESWKFDLIMPFVAVYRTMDEC
ncbi:hypothetical protein LINGRAHAP2_LOCUS24628 [Linum grandiflorum]